MTPSNALQAAIYARLTAYSGLMSLVTGVYDFVPEEARPPYVVIGDDTAIDDSTKTESGWEVTVTIHCWDYEVTGRKGTKSILSAIYNALHRNSLTLAGFELVDIQYEFEQTFQDPSAEGQSDRYYHGVQRYRALIETT